MQWRPFRGVHCWRGVAISLAVLASQVAWAKDDGLSVIDPTPNIFKPHSGPADLLISNTWFVIALMGGILVIVGGTWLYTIFRFRQKRGEELSEPAQIYGSSQIEIAWTVIPILIVVALFLTTARYLFAVQDAPIPASALRVTAVGHQFWWEFRYPKYGFVTANEMHVPVSTQKIERTTSIKIQSADVDHSFWVPALMGKIDNIPNQTNHIWFDPSPAGIYVGQCAQFCGTAHADMLLRVYVESPEKFQAWVANQQKPAVQDPAVAQGRQLFESESCSSCHTIRGTSANGTFGPDLTHLMSRDTIASGIVPNTAANLAAWIKDPEALKPGSLMPAMKLSDDQIHQIVQYLVTLK